MGVVDCYEDFDFTYTVKNTGDSQYQIKEVEISHTFDIIYDDGIIQEVIDKVISCDKNILSPGESTECESPFPLDVNICRYDDFESTIKAEAHPYTENGVYTGTSCEDRKQLDWQVRPGMSVLQMKYTIMITSKVRKKIFKQTRNQQNGTLNNRPTDQTKNQQTANMFLHL